ncbi:Nn.00g052800.m01.CDS01 [Neocucurbitaria sp. VM-36]
MARLRKPSPNEPSIFMPYTEAKATRTSPRKATRELRYTSPQDEEVPVLVPKSSRRDLRYTNSSAQEVESSFLLAKTIPAMDALTPRKQRILRPVESNSRLLRKLSDESLASPEKKQRERRVRSGTMDTDIGKRGRLMYTKSLAKSVVNKQAMRGIIDVVGEAEAQEAAQRPRSKGSERQEEAKEIEVDEEAETSLWCGDEDDGVQEPEKDQVGNISDEEEDEDADPVVDPRSRRRQPQSRRVVCQSDEDESDASEENLRNHNRQPSFKIPERKAKESTTDVQAQPLASIRPPHRKGHSTISNWAQEFIDLTSSPEVPATDVLPPPTLVQTASFAASSRPTSSASNGALAILTYSPTPTKHRSPRKAPPISRPSTPPALPASPSKLVSPSKKRPTVPKTEHLDGRPSLDVFWNPVAVNEWNERHSPSKPLVSPRKQKWREDIVKMMEGVALEDSSDEDKGYESPYTSPRKKNSAPPLRSPTKKTTNSDESPAEPTVKDIRAQRKAFAERKHALATSFLISLDTTISSGLITSLAAPTGGIKLIWSKTLKTTAGRANWRRETLRTRTGPSTPLTSSETQTTILHHCSIELAEKVIDDETRLYNVLAHEFCHLTTFMISNVRNNPHGAEFKAWGKKASEAFRHLGVEVTTKHSYQIEYKYVWECVSCGYEFKRHSKSVDPARHSCGKCKGRLAQTKPKPRGGGSGGTGASAGSKDGKKAGGEYQGFVKENFQRVKRGLELEGREAGMGKVMEAVAREYREMKAAKGKMMEVGKETEVGGLEEALEGLEI